MVWEDLLLLNTVTSKTAGVIKGIADIIIDKELANLPIQVYESIQIGAKDYIIALTHCLWTLSYHQGYCTRNRSKILWSHRSFSNLGCIL